MATLAAVLAGAILGGGSAGADAAIVSMAAASSLQLKYSRDNEEEADRIGMLSLVSAGYDGTGMLNLLKAMKNFEFYSNVVPSYFLTHPGTDDRIHYIDGLLQTRYKKGGATNILGGLPRIQTLLLLDERDTDASQKQFETRLKKNPHDIDALYGLAIIKERLGNVKSSMDLFSQALELAPEDIDILRGIGVGYFRLGKMAQAVDYLRKAYAIDDHDGETILFLARSYEETGDFRTALRLYQDLLKSKPDDGNIYYSLGMNYGKTGNQGESHFYFGMYNKKKDKHDTALFHFREALKYFPAESVRHSDTQKEIDEVTPKPKEKNPFDARNKKS